MAFKAILDNLKLLISLVVVCGGIVFRNELKNIYDNFLIYPNGELEGIYTDAVLAQYDGNMKKKLYLAVLGVVFDVTEGRKHYEKGAGYHYFVGKDGSRALITGNFSDESKDRDHVMDLSCTELFTLLHWRDTFHSKYEKVGILIGRFFKRNGEQTAYSVEFNNKIEQCEIQKEISREADLKYPPCNIAWSADEGTKVWCTKSSGGVIRSWIGVPRQLYTPGIEQPRCVCVNTEEKESPQGLLKKYNNCPNTSTTCMVD